MKLNKQNQIRIKTGINKATVGLKTFCLKKSLWVFHFGGASCNNCDIEILDCLTPRYDIERLGMKLVGSPRHADIILVNGSINKRDRIRLLEVYETVEDLDNILVTKKMLPLRGAEFYLYYTENNTHKAFVSPANSFLSLQNQMVKHKLLVMV